MCVYIYIYVCVYIYMYVCVCVCVCIYIYIYMYVLCVYIYILIKGDEKVSVHLSITIQIIRCTENFGSLCTFLSYLKTCDVYCDRADGVNDCVSNSHCEM